MRSTRSAAPRRARRYGRDMALNIIAETNESTAAARERSEVHFNTIEKTTNSEHGLYRWRISLLTVAEFGDGVITRARVRDGSARGVFIQFSLNGIERPLEGDLSDVEPITKQVGEM